MSSYFDIQASDEYFSGSHRVIVTSVYCIYRDLIALVMISGMLIKLLVEIFIHRLCKKNKATKR